MISEHDMHSAPMDDAAATHDPPTELDSSLQEGDEGWKQPLKRKRYNEHERLNRW